MMMNGNVHRTLVAAGFGNLLFYKIILLSGEEGIESTEPAKMLLRMWVTFANNHIYVRLLKRVTTKFVRTRTQVHDANFISNAKEYIRKYGDQTIGELKLESITLRQRCQLFVCYSKKLFKS